MMSQPSDGTPGAAGPRTPAGVVTIRCRVDGPLVVEMPESAGDGPLELRITDHLGTPFPIPATKRSVALCRCGQTKTRPLCDGSHKSCGFQASDTAPTA